MKSPLKSNIHFNNFKVLNNLLSPNSKISSFFLRDGAVETYLADHGHMVVSHTNKIPIFELWSAILQDPYNLAEGVQLILPILDDEQFVVFQESWHMNQNLRSRNVLFYILSMCSDSGYASIGKMKKDNLNFSLISKLKTFKVENFYPYLDQCNNQIEAIETAKKTDYILLPIGKYSLNLFEAGKNKGPDMYTFNHKDIHSRVKNIDKKCILLYKSHPALFKMYAGFNITMVDKYGRLASTKDACEELIIANF